MSTRPSLSRLLGIELVQVSKTEKLVAASGGALAILLLVLVSRWAVPDEGAVAVVTSMGASAVLLFAVPHGPLSQPWPVVAGNTFSALIGVTCARLLPGPALASACAVGLAIAAMQILKCIHPPGGATAFTAVMGSQAIHNLGYRYVLFPVLANATLMVAVAVLFNYFFPWRRYPAALNASARPTPADVKEPSHEAVLEALKSLDSFVDISEEDLIQLSEFLATQMRGAGRRS